jgi:DUF1680 family protein
MSIMNKMRSSFIFILLLCGIDIHSQPIKIPVLNKVNDKLTSIAPASVKINGYLGEKIDLCIDRRIKSQDVDHLIEPFRHKEETRLWQSEFWGKWIQSAIAAYDYNHDPELLSIIKNAVSGLLATQMPNGYIGNYSDEAALQNWDIWGQKYTLLGLLAYFDLTGNKSALSASERLADHLLTQIGPGKADIVKTGNFRGMPSSSILEPIVYLYRRSGEKRYLDFAEYIVHQWETADGPKLISAALAGVPVAKRFPHPASWWSYENGQKAYEMMSCYDGLLELYKVIGEPSYLKAVEMSVKDIIDNEINVAGSGSAFECWYNGAKYQTEPTYHTMETCVTMTWMKLCFNLLRVTGNPAYADEIEKSAYNALMASMKYDGSMIAKYSPLGGIRHEGEEQCGMHINCCNANGPRAFMMLPRFAVMDSPDEIYINLYTQGEFAVPLNAKNIVRIDQITDYPATEKIEIKVNPDKPLTFTLFLRIPAWSRNTVIAVNGTEVPVVTSGTYNKITRIWSKGDKVELKLDLSGRVVNLNGCQAILRGPVVLARDTRFSDGFIYESAVIKDKDGIVELKPSSNKKPDIWMSFTAPLVLGTDLEGDFKNPRQISFCDFASAGNTWGEDSRYLVWLPKTLNVMQTDYKSY